MVCIYCGSKTQVINSRHQKRSNRTWRRRECLKCRSVFTTEEVALYSSAWLVEQKNGRFEAFNRDRLMVSLLQALKHRRRALGEAAELADTVVIRLAQQTNEGKISRSDIKQLCLVVLSRFDAAAATSYEAFHKN